MEAVATQKFIRTSPKKLRLIAQAVSKMTPVAAIERLPFMPKRGAIPFMKVVKTAVGNAVVLGASPENLVFKEVQILEGPRLKRGIAVSRGQWHPIIKRMSHIKVVVMTKPEKVERKTKEVAKNEEPKKGAKNKSIKQ